MPVTYDEIAVLAYEFWKERGEPVGSPEVDWERAEATLQLRAVKLVKTAISESEPNFAGGVAGDELLAEKTGSVGDPEQVGTQSTDAPAEPSRPKASRRRGMGKQSASGTPASS